ncbi:MAG: AarF/ABC1/UbiB kinase family protein [Deltaproteobacteria bacterium]|nr:AarF/ABC1/UbiB kinase family protein [Deltaproteobacteria bacterium]
MKNEIPQGKWQRSVAGSKTAAQVGSRLLKYYAQKPFLSEVGREKARAELEGESAKILFKGLSLLKGTAIKIAQLLSLELDLFPAAVRQELEKSYNQVPAMNQALVRKAIQNAFGRPPEEVFRSFAPQAFAAASLGQVHRATDRDGVDLAVKVQYPGIRNTIASDIQLIRNLTRPWAEFDLIGPALQEIEERLLEEVDYEQEARHIIFFADHLKMDRLRIPEIRPATSTAGVLSTTFLSGKPLNIWLKADPGRKARDAVAQQMYDLFIKSLYDLHCFHADPNPGNFIIDRDLTVGLIDFGCVKKLSPDFVRCYRQLPRAILHHDQKTHFHLFKKLKLLRPGLEPEVQERLFQVMHRFGEWFGKLYRQEVFDFKTNSDFIREGRALTNETFKLRRHMVMNPDFLFLDRNRYGLFRLFEQMGARVRIRNPYEWE